MDENDKKLAAIESQLSQYQSTKKDCLLIKESIMLTIESLNSLYHDLESGNLYGKGSYGSNNDRV